MKMLGNPIKLSETPAQAELFPPRQGEHTAETLSKLGYTQEQIEDLSARGVI